MRKKNHSLRLTALLGCLALLSTACQHTVADYIPVDNDQDEDSVTNITDNYRYQIPVVFHVLYQQGDDISTITEARIKTILSQVNELWKGNVYYQAGRYTGTSGQTTSEDMDVDFVLASRDEKGNATSGIDYEVYKGSWPLSPSDFLTSKSNIQYIWDPNEYVNIMLFDFKDSNSDGSLTLGQTSMPLTTNDNALDGLNKTTTRYIAKNKISYTPAVCISSAYNAIAGKRILYCEWPRYSTTETSGYLNSTDISMDINVTLAHELGHYFGLHHTFAEKVNGSNMDIVDSCDDTDYCDDTPSYNRKEYQQELKELIAKAESANKILSVAELMQRTNCDNLTFTSENFMDYNYTYGFRFTPEQRERVRHVLYYSPMIPGPKKNGVNHSSGSRAEEETVETPLLMSK